MVSLCISHLSVKQDGEDLDTAERALKRRRVHDAEVAWTSVSLTAFPPS